MSRFCSFGGNQDKRTKTLGLVLMATGLVILLLSVPSWLWASALGIVLVSVGYLIWRFG